MAEVVRTAPAEFIEAGAKTYLDDLTKAIGTFKTTDLSTIMGPQFVAGPGALTTQAEGLASGLGGFQPFLTQAQNLRGPTAYQAYMSPYQQDVIDATLTDFDVQSAKGLPALSAQAIQAGAFGGGREGVQLAEYQRGSDMNRSLLQGQLLQQGFTDAAARRAADLQAQQGLGTYQQAMGQAQQGYQQAVLDANQIAAREAQFAPFTQLGLVGQQLAQIQPGAFPTQTVGYAPPAAPASPMSQFLTGAAGGAGILGKLGLFG